jgi:outer membrane biosynthesis protein TonB
MAKFVALYNRLMLSIPFVKKDQSGKVVENRTISFNSGTRVNKNINPAYLSTQDEELLDYLRKYPGNLANGGASFKELITETTTIKSVKAPEPPKTPEEPAKTPEPVKTPEPAKSDEPENTVEPVKTPEPENTPEPVNTASKEADVYDDVTSIQAAFAVLKTYDNELKTSEHRTHDAINSSAERLNVSFPNLVKKK